MKKNSSLTPFIDFQIKKLKENGIIDLLYKRHKVKDPYCNENQNDVQVLGMEKFGALFAMYLFGCLLSVLVLIFEIIIGPKNLTGNKVKRLKVSKHYKGYEKRKKTFQEIKYFLMRLEGRDLSDTKKLNESLKLLCDVLELESMENLC